MAIRFLFMVLATVLALGAALPGGRPAIASDQTSVTAEHVNQAKKKPAKKSKKKTAPQKKTAEPAKPKHPMEMPMTVVIVRSASDFCEPLCPEWIAAEGEITAATPALFRKVLKQIGGRKLPVILASPGGNVDSAVQIGRMLRKAGLDVMLGFFMYDGCKPSDKTCKLPESQKGIYRGSPYTLEGYCVSACPLILAGGVKRLAPPEAKIGLHQVRTKWTGEKVRYLETYRIVKGKKKVVSRKVVSRKKTSWTKDGLNKTLRKTLVPYLKEMGLSQDLLAEMEKAPHESINMLSRDRALKLKILTPEKPAVSVFGFTFDCKPEQPEAYCVARPVAKPPPAPKDEMIVEIVRGTGDCEPICSEWIAADGVITRDTPKRFVAVLKEMGDRKLPVLLNSTHGDFDAALEIGRMIRKKGLDTGVAVTGFIDCHPRKLECKQTQPPSLPYKALVYHFGECGRECLLVLAGGVRRYSEVAAGTFFDPPDSISTRHKSKTAAQLAEEYLKEMSLATNLVSFARTGSLAKPIKLTNFQMWVLGFNTEKAPIKSFAGPDACAASAAANNCIRRDKAS
jgi:hypothetical protein